MDSAKREDEKGLGTPRTIERSGDGVTHQAIGAKEYDYVFPSSNNNGGILNGTMDALLIRKGYKPYTVNGFRSTFRDYITEKTNTA